MEPQETLDLFITYVDKEGPFLKVWGQSEKNNSIYVEEFLRGISPQFDQGLGRIPFEKLQVGTLVCAKYKDNKYYRARILSIDNLNECFVEVIFIDYGNKDIVPSDNIRSLHTLCSAFISIPPQATGFIFAEAHCPGGGEWKEHLFEIISRELRYREVQCQLLTQATQYYLVKLFIDNTDIGALLISRGLLQPIPLHAQQAVLLSMSLQKSTPTPLPTGAPSEINSYKASTLEPLQQYAVYVSFVNEGPTLFSVQLQQSEHVLAKLMKEINSINLRMLEDIPLPGTICLARCIEDGNVCRAVVTNEVDNQFKVFYVDFGNYETLPLEALYQIPFKYVLPKVMAIRLSLNGVEKSTVTLDMLLAFKKFVDNRLLYMKVLPSNKKTTIPKCEMWDPETKTNALDVINRAAQHAYPEPLLLNRGFTQPVKVSYVFSCNRFYVQLAAKEQELLKVMEDLQISCKTNDTIDVNEIKLGLPCCALYQVDQVWYRSEIVDIIDRENVKVRYIDYGNEEVISIAHLKMIEGELLTVLRPQAIECCLNGYQNMGTDKVRDNLLEELILEQTFTMKVSEMLGRKALVELIDAANYNVASLLLDKIATAKSQVSPLLVQAGNKIEHRKSDSSDTYRPQRKPARDNTKEWKGRSDRSDSRSSDRPSEKSWRTGSLRQSDSNSNDDSPEKGSWRQTSKGLRNNERPDRDRGNRSEHSKKTNINDRINRPRHDNKNNWNNRDAYNQSNSWAAAVNENGINKSNSGLWDTTLPSAQASYDDRRHRDKFSGNKRRFDHDKADRSERNSWAHNKDSNKRDGFKKEYRKDGSEMSSSGSEKSFKRNLRTSSRNDFGGSRFHNRSNNASFESSASNETWNMSEVSVPLDAASFTATFKKLNVVGTESQVMISWFHNPGHFYCQLQSVQDEFKTLMEDIQQTYKNRKPEHCPVGAPVIGYFPEDKVLYRAQILESSGGQFKVFYVDFGNVATVTKVWAIEKKFMNLPAQAICCGLNFVNPTGESWPDCSTFSKYFEKEFYTAKFLYNDDIRTYIELWDRDEDIRNLLVQDNLVVVTPPPQAPEVDVALLLNQQFRVILKSVNNLMDIIIALECGLALNCKAHNLESATECFENVLKSYIEKTLIIYVDNILTNNVLDVTFYDNSGNKLVILNPDDGALDTVEPLCPLLILSAHITGFVSGVDGTSIYIQPNDITDLIGMLLVNLDSSYNNSKQETSIIPEEGSIYAVRSNDGHWYRGQVTTFDNTEVIVFYVDYGTKEKVGFDALRQLKSEFNVPNMLCTEVKINSEQINNLLGKEIVLEIYYGESGWEGIIESTCDTAPKGEHLNDDNDVTQEETTGYLYSENEVFEETALVESEDDAEQRGTSVYVSHIDSPTEFYVQFAQASTTLDELQVKLQKTVEEMPVLETVSVGILCAAPYSVDHQWYRAEVLDADDDITTVRFVDYGNTDVINNKTTQLKTLPPSLLSLAVYATRCSLKLKSIDEEWSQAALELFENLTSQDNLVAELLIQDEKIHIIELYANSQNVKDALLAQNFAVPCEIVLENKATCFVSHLNSPSEFWIQLENCVDELEWIAEQLSGAESFPELDDMAPGTLCAALFPDDEMWYRARILSNTIAGIELLFIDYGNSCVSSSLRQLPEDLVVTPPLAQKCCLQRPDGIPYWTKEAQDKFNEISADGQTIFEMKKLTTGETATIELLLNGESIVPRILPLTEPGLIRNFRSLNEFNLEKNGEVLSETFSLETMPGLTWNEDSNKKFLELYPIGTMFGIETISEDEVRLYLNNTDIRPRLGGIKTNLNSSNAEANKTELLDDSENVIDYNSGGDNLNTNHSNKAGAKPGDDVKKLSDTFTKTQICDNDTSNGSE
ncbi:tudor domain containing protein isoform X2 [Rhynchophorus ferrugineus]|uniref:tudor domain containing protein isoform X2 n=1 Tax=Rhynchophorus ferrugineus TaxID=354439 RepID=UPI003FCD40DF